MSCTDDYPRLIKMHFAYLVDDFGYKVVEDKYSSSSASYLVCYKSDSRFIKLLWGLRDAQFYFAVHKLKDNGEPFPYSDSGEGFFYFFSLAKHFEPSGEWPRELDIGTATPTEEILDEKIKLNSQILLKYGKGILTGAEWFDDKSSQIIKDKTV